MIDSLSLHALGAEISVHWFLEAENLVCFCACPRSAWNGHKENLSVRTAIQSMYYVDLLPRLSRRSGNILLISETNSNLQMLFLAFTWDDLGQLQTCAPWLDEFLELP